MMNSTILRLSAANQLPETMHGGMVAIGNFDGVHRGHRAVLENTLQLASTRNVPAIVLTFEPHPRSIFRPDQPVFRLTPAPLRARVLQALGFHAIIEQPFDRGFASLEPQAFIQDILVDGLHISHVTTGYDFHFGRNRAGTPGTLVAAGKKFRFGVELMDPFRDEGGEVISSSRVRACLARGDVVQAAGLLGYRYTVEAEIISGKQLGRTLGYPTANMRLADNNELAHGIYAVRFTRADGSVHDGVASFGRRPTVDSDGMPLLETFVFDFSGDLYGEICSVSFFGFLRGEEKFDDMDALVEQMKTDEAEARALLASVRPMGVVDAKLAFGEAE